MREAMTQAQGRYDSTSRTNKPTKMKTIELVISRDKIENNVRYNVADLIDPSFAGRGGNRSQPCEMRFLIARHTKLNMSVTNHGILLTTKKNTK